MRSFRSFRSCRGRTANWSDITPSSPCASIAKISLSTWGACLRYRPRQSGVGRGHSGGRLIRVLRVLCPGEAMALAAQRVEEGIDHPFRQLPRVDDAGGRADQLAFSSNADPS